MHLAVKRRDSREICRVDGHGCPSKCMATCWYLFVFSVDSSVFTQEHGIWTKKSNSDCCTYFSCCLLVGKYSYNQHTCICKALQPITSSRAGTTFRAMHCYMLHNTACSSVSEGKDQLPLGTGQSVCPLSTVLIMKGQKGDRKLHPVWISLVFEPRTEMSASNVCSRYWVR